MGTCFSLFFEDHEALPAEKKSNVEIEKKTARRGNLVLQNYYDTLILSKTNKPGLFGSSCSLELPVNIIVLNDSYYGYSRLLKLNTRINRKLNSTSFFEGSVGCRPGKHLFAGG